MQETCLSRWAILAAMLPIRSIEAWNQRGGRPAARCPRASGCCGKAIYEDRASGKRDDRPNLEACLKALRKGDVLVVWKLNRLGRNLRHLVNTVQDFADRGIGFKVLSGQGAEIDSTTGAGKLVFGIFVALAEFGRELIRERTRAGLQAARAHQKGDGADARRGRHEGPDQKRHPEGCGQEGARNRGAKGTLHDLRPGRCPDAARGGVRERLQTYFPSPADFTAHLGSISVPSASPGARCLL